METKIVKILKAYSKSIYTAEGGYFDGIIEDDFEVVAEALSNCCGSENTVPELRDKAESFCDSLEGMPEDYTDLKDLLMAFAEEIIWHGPDEVPPRYSLFSESILVVNQSGENVFFDFIDQTWVNYQIPSRSAHVEKWRYHAPIKKQDGGQAGE